MDADDLGGSGGVAGAVCCHPGASEAVGVAAGPICLHFRGRDGNGAAVVHCCQDGNTGDNGITFNGLRQQIREVYIGKAEHRRGVREQA